jgi:hypothetical protein
MLRRSCFFGPGIAAAILVLAGCESARNAGSSSDADADADADADTDADSDTDSDVDADADADTDGLIHPDCSDCPAVGDSPENMRCAIDLCDDEVFVSQSYGSPTISEQAKLAQTRTAVSWFGYESNDLEPLYPEGEGSYALMATGPAVPSDPPALQDHNGSMSGTLLDPDGPGVEDPWAPYEYPSYDVVEWSIDLVAPAGAHGFRVHYVFFSVEYDEYVGNVFNDKFYIVLEAQSTDDGEPTIINFTDCRPEIDQADFTCPADHPACEEGEEYCYLAINSALSECCWYLDCPDGPAETDISGTGFSCGPPSEDCVGDYCMGLMYGSSTGWLKTEWPIEPGEEFTVTFHLHDTADSLLDSEVILDKFVFTGEANAGTVPIE